MYENPLPVQIWVVKVNCVAGWLGLICLLTDLQQEVAKEGNQCKASWNEIPCSLWIQSFPVNFSTYTPRRGMKLIEDWRSLCFLFFLSSTLLSPFASVSNIQQSPSVLMNLTRQLSHSYQFPCSMFLCMSQFFKISEKETPNWLASSNAKRENKKSSLTVVA